MENLLKIFRPETITEGNEEIMKFLGYKKAPCNNGLAWNRENRLNLADNFSLTGLITTATLPFHNSWDSLMDLIHVISNCADFKPVFEMSDEECEAKRIYNMGIASKMSSVWVAVVDFAKWENSKKK